MRLSQVGCCFPCTRVRPEKCHFLILVALTHAPAATCAPQFHSLCRTSPCFSALFCLRSCMLFTLSPSTTFWQVVSQSVSLVDEPLALSSHVTRRLIVATVQCVGLTAAVCGGNLNTALSGSADEIVLEDGTYAGSTFTIGRDVTLRAQNAEQVVLDGENTRTVMLINSYPYATVTVEGLNITNGRTAEGHVSACF